MFSKMRVYKKTWVVYKEFSKMYGPVTTLYIGRYRMISINTSELIYEALQLKGKEFNFRTAKFMPMLKDIPKGVAFSEGREWQQRRRFALRAMRDFGMGRTGMLEKVHDELGHFLEEIDKQVGKPMKTRMLLTNTVSNVICSLVFGKRFEYNDPDFVDLVGNIQSIVSRPFTSRAIFLIMPFLHYFMKSPDIENVTKLRATIGKLLREAISEHRKDFTPEIIRDFPDLFIQTEMSDEEAVDFHTLEQIMIDMFFAGTETTSTALDWTLLFLTKFPAIQQVRATLKV